MTKECLASRTGLRKSYIKNIKMHDFRKIPEHKHGWYETDWSFDYKGTKMVCVEHIVPNKDGEVKYSAKFRYELKEA